MEKGRRGGGRGLAARRQLPGHGFRLGCGSRRTPVPFAVLAAATVATAAAGTIATGAIAATTGCAHAPAAPPAPPATDAPQSRTLMLWGGVTPGGQLRLDPAFVMDVPEKLPSSAGPYRLEVVGDGGATLLALDFAMDEISDGGGGFLFMAPFREEWRGTLDRIVLRGPEGTITLDRDTRRPMAIVIDRASGQIRAILRGDAVEARIEAAETEGEAEAADGTRVLVSYGLPGQRPQ